MTNEWENYNKKCNPLIRSETRVDTTRTPLEELDLDLRSCVECLRVGGYAGMSELLRKRIPRLNQSAKIVDGVLKLWFELLDHGLGGLPDKREIEIFNKLSNLLPKEMKRRFTEEKK